MYVALKIDKIEFYLCVEKQAGCTCMEGEKGSGTDISKHPISSFGGNITSIEFKQTLYS